MAASYVPAKPARAESQFRALLWVAFGAALWGTDTLFRRPLTAAWSSARIVLLEHLILSAVLLPVFWRTRRQWLRLDARDWAAVVGISWGGSALGTICFTQAVRIGNPTTAVLLQKTQPLFAAVLAAALLGEVLGRRFWMCLAAALAGAVLVSGLGAAPSWAGWMAPLLALAAAVLWGASTVLGRFLTRRLSFPAITALRIVAALPLLLAMARPGAPAAAGAPPWLALLLLALVPGLAALLAYYRGLSHCPASRAAIAELSFPATAALLNWIFFDARATPMQWAGFAVLWSAILCLGRRR